MSAVKAVVHRMETVVEVTAGTPRAPRESVLVALDNGTVLEGWRTINPLSFNYGGVEVHYAEKPEYMDESDWNVYCVATGRGCFHDGSSLAFDDLGLDALFEAKLYDSIAELIAARHGVGR